MRKSKTAVKKAASTRNRHNGRINAYKAHVIKNGREFSDSAGVNYVAIKTGDIKVSIKGHQILKPKYSVVKAA